MQFKPHRSKAKKLHLCPFVADVTWVKWLKDLFVDRRLTQSERKDKNVDVLNLTRKSNNVPAISTRKRPALTAT